MPNYYEEYIKCKYCGHFSKLTNKCYLYTSYDSSHDEGNEHKYRACKDTFPYSRCSHFRLDLMHGFRDYPNVPLKRWDGSYEVDFRDVPWLKEQLEKEETVRIRKAKQGCYVATCVYGSYDCPQVWTLRRFRDEFLSKSAPGRAFICAYYKISPKVVKSVGNTSVFKIFFRAVLDSFVVKLNANGYSNLPYNDKQW